MARPYEQFKLELNGSLTRAFQESNPGYWAALQDRPRDIERVQQVLADAEQHLEAIEEEYQDTRQSRVAEEVVNIFDARQRDALYAAPEVQQHVLHGNSLLQQARENVSRFHEVDKSQIKTESEWVVQDIADYKDRNGTFRNKEEIEHMSETEKSTHFKAEVHAVGEQRDKAEYQARKLFANTREELIDQARDNGSEQPEQDVSRLYRSMMDDVRKQFHKDLHDVFTRYGWDYSKKEVQFFENPEPKDFDQDQPSHEAESDFDPDSGPEIGGDDQEN